MREEPFWGETQLEWGVNEGGTLGRTDLFVREEGTKGGGGNRLWLDRVVEGNLLWDGPIGGRTHLEGRPISVGLNCGEGGDLGRPILAGDPNEEWMHCWGWTPIYGGGVRFGRGTSVWGLCSKRTQLWEDLFCRGGGGGIY